MAFDMKQVDAGLKKLMDPKAAGDLNVFLENMPKNAGQTVLIAAGIAWAMAGALGLYATVQAQMLTDMRAEYLEAEALTPIVPKITEEPIAEGEVRSFVEKVKESYPGLNFQVSGASIIITSSTTNHFSRFREAIGHMQNGGSGWRVSLEKMCVGRECDPQHKLAVSLRVNKVSVEDLSKR